MQVVNWKTLNLIDDGCGGVIYKILDVESSGLKKMEIAMCIFEPEETATLHYHNKMEEIYFIIEGEGEVELDGVWHPINPEDSVAIPIGVKHRVRNTSKTKQLKFLSINAPEWQSDDMIFVD